MTRTLAVVREALASARSQPVASFVSMLIVAGMCAAVLLTSGRTVGAEQAVIGSIDSEGTRSIIVRADPAAGLDASVLDRLAEVEGIAWAGAFGEARDATNVRIADGIVVPVRQLWTTDPGELGIPSSPAQPGSTAWASALALDRLGMADGFGGILTKNGAAYSVAGELDTPDLLSALEPLVVVPQGGRDRHAAVSILVVIAARADLVAPVSSVVQSLLAVDDPGGVTVTTSETLASLRALVQGELGSFGRNLTLLVLGLTTALVAVILYGLVLLRRKDFGRRRALGASRTLIVCLLVTQTALLSAAGTIVGTGSALLALAIGGDPLPSAGYLLALGILAVAVGPLAAVVPAIAASRRDPLTELRVP